MNKPNLIHQFERWRTSQAELLRTVDSLRKENERLRQKVAALQQAKDQAEKHADDRRREKDALRERLAAQKKTAKSKDVIVQQLGAKITELRAEIELLKTKPKKSRQRD